VAEDKVTRRREEVVEVVAAMEVDGFENVYKVISVLIVGAPILALLSDFEEGQLLAGDSIRHRQDGANQAADGIAADRPAKEHVAKVDERDATLRNGALRALAYSAKHVRLALAAEQQAQPRRVRRGRRRD
jgi:hypothetical protein